MKYHFMQIKVKKQLFVYHCTAMTFNKLWELSHLTLSNHNFPSGFNLFKLFLVTLVNFGQFELFQN
jgi:hypothetical protein